MTCERVPMLAGGFAIVCSRTRTRPRKCRSCGAPADLLCDWKKPRKKSGTCDAPICSGCAVSPAKDKDLCPAHAAEFEKWKAARPCSPGPMPANEGAEADSQSTPARNARRRERL